VRIGVAGFLASLGALALAAAPMAASAQVTDQVLNEAKARASEACVTLKVKFNLPFRLVSSFPADGGDEVRVRIAPIEGGVTTMGGIRESLRVPDAAMSLVGRIEFEGDRPDGPTVTVSFRHNVFFKLTQGGDFRSLDLVVADQKARLDCVPAEPQQAQASPPPPPPPGPAAAAVPAVPVAEGPAMTDAERAQVLEARTALAKGDLTRAIQVLTHILEGPNGGATQTAHELLGVARERNNQAAHAKAEYETYLRLYPTGADSDRVRQRLAALMATAGRPPTQVDTLAAKGRDRRDREKGDWRAGGSLSTYYMRDETHQRISDDASNTTTELNDTNLNQVLTAGDMFATYVGDKVRVKFRASGTYTNDFRPRGHDIGALSALNVEIADSRQRYMARLGRQTRSTGGVLGRFDGGLASIRLNDMFKLEFVAGSPVLTPKKVMVDKDRVFYGTSLAFGRFRNAWDGDIYVIEQRSHGEIDRRAVGAELRYLRNGRSVFSAVDYDIHFNTLNFAIVNGSWTYGDGGALTFSMDYRRSPLLFTDNALIGQPVFGIDQLRVIYSDGEIRQLAMDRSAEAKTVTLGIAQPLSKKLSFNTDLTVSQVSATPESGGVPASPATGTEYYLSAQLIGSGLFREGDIGILGLRYADTNNMSAWLVDLNTRYPWSRTFRINPRLQVGYRQNKNNSGTELSARPSLRLYYMTRHKLQFEPEVGGEWLQSNTPTGHETTTGYYVNMGLRRDF